MNRRLLNVIERQSESGTYSSLKVVEAFAQLSSHGSVARLEQDFIETILAEFSTQSDLSTLDIGSGPAWIPSFLKKVKPRWQMTAVEISPIMIQEAQKRALAQKTEIRFVQASASQIPLASESFDLIICHLAFSEFPEAKKCLAEMQRLLKPGGRILIRDLHRPFRWLVPLTKLSEWICYPKNAEMRRQLRDSLKGAYTLEEINGLLRTSALPGVEFEAFSKVKIAEHTKIFGLIPIFIPILIISVLMNKSVTVPVANHPSISA